MNITDVIEIAKEAGAKWFDDKESLVISGKCGSGDGLDFCIKFAELLEAKFKDRWISVDDRLPTVSETAKDFQLASGESDRVLILMNGYEHIGTYHSNIDTWSIPFHSGSNWKPTHWMPLPKDTK